MYCTEYEYLISNPQFHMFHRRQAVDFTQLHVLVGGSQRIASAQLPIPRDLPAIAASSRRR